MALHLIRRSLDDLIHETYVHLLKHGRHINPTKGPAIEEFGTILQLDNPRDRISRSQNRARPFSAIGELLWYLSKGDRQQFIAYYVKYYEDSAENDGQGGISGAYGPRLFNFDGINQITTIISKLRENPDTRNAIVQIYDHEDSEHAPCTLTLQFAIRDQKLMLMTNMRSNDAYVGLPHDIYAFTMLQELVASDLGIEMGPYVHSVGSLHLYKTDLVGAREYIEEGLHTSHPMDPMPRAHPWTAVEQLLKVEESIRCADELSLSDLELPDERYWRDLVLMLAAYKLTKNKDIGQLRVLEGLLHTPAYRQSVREKIAQLGRK